MTLTYLTNQKLFIGSHLGNSQLLHISQTPTSSLTLPTLPIPTEIPTVRAAELSKRASSGKGKEKETSLDDDETWNVSKGAVVDTMGSFVNVLDTFTNIAPIMDAALVDMDGSGQV